MEAHPKGEGYPANRELHNGVSDQTSELPQLSEGGEPLIYLERSDEIEEYSGTGCCHPSSLVHRSFVLVFMCLLAFGSYYCYDNPAAISEEIKKDMGISPQAYYSLYTFYSTPNVILCFFGGFLIDSVFGIRMGALIFAAITFLGQVIVALGALVDNFYLMVFGRFIFGIGGESLAVAQNTYAVLWFKGKELNTVFGLQLSVARLASMANFESFSYLYDYIQKFYSGHTGLGVALMIASAFCLMSLCCALVLFYFDKRAERYLNRANLNESTTINMSDILRFPLQFWLLCLMCILYYVSVFPFFSGATDFLTEKYKMKQEYAASIMGIPFTVSAIISPFCGMLCDLTGLNLFWTIVATVITAACHLSFSFLSADALSPELILGTFGVGFSLLACAFWPLIALVVPQHQLGTAYGVVQALQNLGVALVSEGAGFVKAQFGYQILELYFLSWIILAGVVAAILQLQNIATNGVLNPPLYRRWLRYRSNDTDSLQAIIED